MDLKSDDYHTKIDPSGIHISKVSSGNDIILDGESGRVGIGTTDPKYPLEVNGDTASNRLHLRNGNPGSMYTRSQIAFGYAGATDTWRHHITSRHSSTDYSNDNALDFHICKGLESADELATGTKNVMSIAYNGVGIGITTPSAPLHVDKYATNYPYGAGWHWFQASYDTDWHPTNSASTANISIRASQAIWSENSFVVSSDSRIKTDISDIDDDRALQQVNALESKEYHYIDPMRRKTTKTIGFIAQEVKEIIPNAVSLQTDWLPDEMRVITTPQWDANVLTISDLDMLVENLTGKCRFYVSNDPSGNDEIKVEIECEKDLSGNNTNQFIFDEQYKNVFFHGKEVDDFHTIDKNQIFALHHSAIQELSRRNDTLVAENTAKTAEISELKNEISLIKQHLGI